jgi:2-dehydropantoate 2-reductase
MVTGRPIAVIGAGPVGSIVAAHLSSIGQEILLVECAGERLEQIQQHGLAVTGKVEIATQLPFLLKSIEDLARIPLTALFICTKAWALKALLPQLAAVVDPNTPVISFQNGIGPEDEIANFFPRQNVSRAVVNFAGGVPPDGGPVVMQWFNAPNYIAPLDGGSAALMDIIEKLTVSGLATEMVSSHEIKKKVFFKTILNSALNALCASTGISMRQAMSLPHTRNLANLLIREGLSVGSAVGYYYGENSLQFCTQYLDQGGDHLPSMWGDLERGLPTEIEYMNGKIVQIGMMFKNVDVDVNVFFTSMIITREIRSGARKADDIPGYLTGPYRGN